MPARAMPLSLVNVCLCLCSLQLSSTAAAEMSKLPVVSPPPGSHYDVMKAVGVAMKSEMRRYADNFPALETVLRPFAKSTQGEAIITAYVNANKALFPTIYDEIRGLADGS